MNLEERFGKLTMCGWATGGYRMFWNDCGVVLRLPIPTTYL